MEDNSFFSGLLRNASDYTKFNHKQKIVQERIDAINYAKKLEKEFNIRYKAFKQQLTELLSRNKELEQQNKAKDQLLNGNSKVIMNKTTEIIKLKDEIKELKERLVKAKKLKLNLSTQPLKRTNSCPSSSKKKKEPNKPLPIMQKKIINEINQLPFIHRKTSTQTSSLSEAAVNLSFPSNNDMINIIDNDNNNHSLQIQQISTTTTTPSPIKPLQLSPICEMKSRDDNNYNKNNTNLNLNLVKISDNNSNIISEWGKSIASSDTSSIRSSSETSDDIMCITNTNKDNISLMSDNTVMLDDVHYKKKINNIEIMSNGHFSQKSSGNLDGCDIIQSPVNVFSINHSFRIVLNNQNQ